MTGWDRVASVYEPLMRPLESVLLGRWRRRAVAELPAAGRVLEIGAGPGMNSRFYPASARAVLTDLSVAMMAAAAARGRGLAVVADAEALPFRTSAFDGALATLVFCNVPDYRSGLRELRRVVRPGGRCVWLEHVRPGSRAGGFLFDLLERLTGPLLGEHVNRRTADHVAQEFAVERVENAFGTILRLIVARR